MPCIVAFENLAPVLYPGVDFPWIAIAFSNFRGNLRLLLTATVMGVFRKDRPRSLSLDRAQLPYRAV